MLCACGMGNYGFFCGVCPGDTGVPVNARFCRLQRFMFGRIGPLNQQYGDICINFLGGGSEMKKLYYRALLTIVVLACAMPFVMKGKDGRPLLQFSELKMPNLAVPGKESIGHLTDTFERDGPAGQSDKVTVYRWKDDQGIWHFSNKGNPDGHSETVQVSVDRTTVVTPDNGVSTQTRPVSRAEELLEEPLPILHAGEILEEARNVETVLQQRYQRQEQIISR